MGGGTLQSLSVERHSRQPRVARSPRRIRVTTTPLQATSISVYMRRICRLRSIISAAWLSEPGEGGQDVAQPVVARSPSCSFTREKAHGTGSTRSAPSPPVRRRPRTSIPPPEVGHDDRLPLNE